MVLTNGLKRICDVSFYLTFASFLAAFFYGDPLIATLPIFAIVAFLSATLASQPFLKYASTLFLTLCFVVVPMNIVNVLTLLPAVTYVIYAVPKPDEKVSQLEYVDVFKLFLKCFIGLIVVAFIFQWQEELDNGSLLLGLSFLVNATILMRMVRHDDEILMQTRFKVMNSLSLVGVMTAVLLFSSEVFLTFVGDVLSFVWTRSLAPAIWFLWMVFARILSTFFSLFNLNPRRGEFSEVEISTEPLEAMEPELSEVPMLFFVVMALIILVLVFKLFYMLSQRHGLRSTNEGVVETRTTLDEKGPRSKRRRQFNPIREIYGKYLAQLKKNEMEIAPYMTTLDIERKSMEAFNSDASNELREMYINVRYGEEAFDREDVKEMKRRYKAFSQKMKEGQKQSTSTHDFNKK